MLTAHSLCWLCQMPMAIARWGICSRCATSLAFAHSLCPRCGLPAAVSRVSCGRCLRDPPPWQRLVTVNDYRPPLSGLIHQLKFSVDRSWRQRWPVCCCYAFARGKDFPARPSRQRPAVAATSMAARLQSKRPAMPTVGALAAVRLAP